MTQTKQNTHRPFDEVLAEFSRLWEEFMDHPQTPQDIEHELTACFDRLYDEYQAPDPLRWAQLCAFAREGEDEGRVYKPRTAWNASRKTEDEETPFSRVEYVAGD